MERKKVKTPRANTFTLPKIPERMVKDMLLPVFVKLSQPEGYHCPTA
jgi:hypothetical protein